MLSLRLGLNLLRTHFFPIVNSTTTTTTTTTTTAAATTAAATTTSTTTTAATITTAKIIPRCDCCQGICPQKPRN